MAEDLVGAVETESRKVKPGWYSQSGGTHGFWNGETWVTVQPKEIHVAFSSVFWPVVCAVTVGVVIGLVAFSFLARWWLAYQIDSAFEGVLGL